MPHFQGRANLFLSQSGAGSESANKLISLVSAVSLHDFGCSRKYVPPTPPVEPAVRSHPRTLSDLRPYG
jgi:hypothetical protein